MARLWDNSYGELNTVELLKSLSGRPSLFIRVNTLKTDKASLKAELEAEGVVCEDVPADENALSLSHTGSLERLSAYKKGLFHVQDLSSQLCVGFLSPKQGDIMLDICSAPGGKAFTAAQYMKNRGKLYAFDLFDHKLKLIQNGQFQQTFIYLPTISAVFPDSELTISLTRSCSAVVKDFQIRSYESPNMIVSNFGSRFSIVSPSFLSKYREPRT